MSAAPELNRMDKVEQTCEGMRAEIMDIKIFFEICAYNTNQGNERSNGRKFSKELESKELESIR